MNQSLRNRLIVGAALAIPLAIAVVILATRPGDGGSPDGLTSETSASPQAQRTVAVSNAYMPRPSEPGATLNALRITGRIPGRPEGGTVLTDDDCAPDARGISRCVNRIRLGSGRRLSVRHPHRMMEVPCLSPGELVRVRAA